MKAHPRPSCVPLGPDDGRPEPAQESLCKVASSHSESELPSSLAPEDEPRIRSGLGVDPAEWLAAFGSFGGAGGHPAGLPGAPPELAVRGPQLEVAQLLERWVRRVALGGDHRRGVARLDIGHGPLAGAELLVFTEPGSVRVEVTLPPSVAEAGLGERLTQRLLHKGLSADVTVR